MKTDATNEDFEKLQRRGEELKQQSIRLEEKLEQLHTEIKKITGRIVLPEKAAPPRGRVPKKQ